MQSSCYIRVVLVSLRVLFCTECSRAVVSVWCWSAHACSSVLSAVELLSPCGADSLRVLFCTECSRAVVSVWCWSAYKCSSVLSAVERLSPGGAGHHTRALLYWVQSSCFLSVVLASSCVLFCTECSRDFAAWCLLAHACFSVHVQSSCFLLGTGQSTRALLYRDQSGFLRVVFVSPRVVSCTKCSRAVSRVMLTIAHTCSSVPRAVGLFSA